MVGTHIISLADRRDGILPIVTDRHPNENEDEDRQQKQITIPARTSECHGAMSKHAYTNQTVRRGNFEIC